MLNKRGVVLGTALLILCVLTIIGTAGITVARFNMQITTNMQIYTLNFYAAESGIQSSPVWLKGNLDESDYMNVDYLGTFEKADLSIPEGFFKNQNFSVEIEHQTEMDGGVEKVLLYGDENGDYLNEINFTTGVPLETAYSTGDHVRGGEGKIKATFIYDYIFAMPNAALRVHSNVLGNGVSGSIIGEHEAGSGCADVTDIMYDVAGGTIDYSGNMGDSPVIEESGGIYPYAIMKPTLFKNATQVMTPVNGKVTASDIITSEAETGVIFVTGDAKITNLTGWGILVVDGNFDCAGNLDWHGIIIVGGDLTFSGGGTKTIYGSVVAMGDAVALNGSVDIQYDCTVLVDLLDEHSRYKMTSWKQM